jgi:hypothetical protein
VSEVRSSQLYSPRTRHLINSLPSRGLVSLDRSSRIEGSTHRSLDSIPFGILPREKCYNGVSVRLRIRSHSSVYPGVSYVLTLTRRNSGEVKKYQQ